jgi:hypothetical protein
MLWAFAKADHVAAILFDNMQREFEAMQAASSSGSLDAFKAQVLSLLALLVQTHKYRHILAPSSRSGALEAPLADAPRGQHTCLVHKLNLCLH